GLCPYSPCPDPSGGLVGLRELVGKAPPRRCSGGGGRNLSGLGVLDLAGANGVRTSPVVAGARRHGRAAAHSSSALAGASRYRRIFFGGACYGRSRLGALRALSRQWPGCLCLRG